MMLFITATCLSQETGKKKIIVTKKISDHNGEIRTEQVILEGEEAEKYMMENKNELDAIGGITHIKKEIEVSGDGSEIKEDKHILIEVNGENGQEKAIEWHAKDEIPVDLKQHMEEGQTEIEAEEMVNEEVRVVVPYSDEESKLGIILEHHIGGVRIVNVVKGSAAEAAGLLIGDVIYEVEGKTIGSTLQLKGQLEALKEDSSINMVLLRGGEKKTIEVSL